MPSNALARAAAALAANRGLSIGGLMRAAHCSSGIAQRAIAAQNRAAELLRQQLANGPKRVEHVEPAAEAAKISEHALIAAADALGITAKKGEWRLREEAAEAAQAGGAAGEREGNGSAPAAARKVTAHNEPLRVSAERAKMLLREQLKHGPRPESQIEAAAQAAAIPERAPIAAAHALTERPMVDSESEKCCPSDAPRPVC